MLASGAGGSMPAAAGAVAVLGLFRSAPLHREVLLGRVHGAIPQDGRMLFKPAYRMADGCVRRAVLLHCGSLSHVGSASANAFRLRLVARSESGVRARRGRRPVAFVSVWRHWDAAAWFCRSFAHQSSVAYTRVARTCRVWGEPGLPMGLAMGG